MSSSFNWMGVLLMFLVPLGLGIGCLLASRRIRNKWASAMVRFFGGAALIIFLLFVFFTTPYVWALHLESKWTEANPKTQAQLEACLSLYSRHEIQPAQSPWGNRVHLQPGEHMVEYWLLYSPSAPLDVIYTNDTIAKIYLSYE